MNDSVHAHSQHEHLTSCQLFSRFVGGVCRRFAFGLGRRLGLGGCRVGVGGGRRRRGGLFGRCGKRGGQAVGAQLSLLLLLRSVLRLLLGRPLQLRPHPRTDRHTHNRTALLSRPAIRTCVDTITGPTCRHIATRAINDRCAQRRPVNVKHGTRCAMDKVGGSAGARV